MTGKFITSALLLTLSNVLLAQDSTKSFAISGSVDAYYRYNFDAPSGKTNNYTSFTNSQSSFELGMATIRADGSALSGKVLGTADLGFGRRAEEFSYNEGTGPNGFLTLAAVKQLYVSYMPIKNLKFTIGKWATHIGYEVLDAYANRNYSMDYMFSVGPFSHTGLKAEYSKGAWGFMLGVANPTDNATTISPTKTLLGQVSGGSKNGKIKGYLNYQGAFTPDFKFNQIDLVLTGTVSSQFSIGYNGTVAINSYSGGIKSRNWWGSALYLNYDPTAKVGLTLRGEYLGNKDSVLTSISPSILANKSVYDFTLSLNYKVGPVIIIPELRLDGADQAIFIKNDGITGTKTTVTGLLAVVYKF